MLAIASPQQPTSPFLAAEGRSFDPDATEQAEFDNNNDEESGGCRTSPALGMTASSSSSSPPPLPSSFLPKKKVIRRFSSRTKQQQTLLKNTSSVKRTVSQKRKRAEAHHVSFRDDNLAEFVTIETHGNDEDVEKNSLKKNEIWYNPDELRQHTFDELSRNWQLHTSKGPAYPLEESNLTWRGLEDYAPSPTDSVDCYRQDAGVEKRVEKIRHHVTVVLAIARSIEDRTALEHYYPNEVDQEEEDEYDDDWEAELAEKSYLLSKPDRDEAIERAQKDAYEALREHGVEYGPRYDYGNHDYCYCDYDEESALVATGSNKDVALVPSVIETLVTWFCL